MIGQNVSHFRILSVLGEGGMGTVYKAQDLNLDRFVVLKFLPPALTSDTEIKTRFIREAKATSALEHPNICTIYEIVELPDGQMFIAMGYYEGETLAERMDQTLFDISEAIEIGSQIAAGLNAAHEQGIVHRDIKPANVVFAKGGQVKILDFGLAKLSGQTRVTNIGTVLGTMSYMSPEQISGEDADQRSDIFSFGVLFYEMLTGKHPFEAEHEAALIYQIMSADPAPPVEHRPEIPAQLQSLVLQMLEKNKEDRLPSLKDFINALKSTPPPQELLPDTTQVAEPPRVTRSGAGDIIGPYRLRERVGVGGMGEVWAADQEKPLNRKVALKILKAGMDTQEVVARFEAERQALALMDHPCIAKVYDAGSTPHGRPFFVMELVRGVSITEYCDRHKLTTLERLKLFIKLCEGVQHAHQKAVIHRDLKPSNVLITEVDDKPIPKIIDFGVAKATAQPLTEKTMHTHLGQLIGTPEYMSPEQAELTGENIDTRTDVYSLGVILYELLAAALPFDPAELREAGFDGIRRKIREEDPAKPSRRVTMLGDLSSIAAEKRKTDLSSLAHQLRGDLDWIVMKALEKDRSRRYASALDLAADIERHLKDEPVLARPPSSTYRIQKFIKRHKVGVAAAALVLFALLIGIAGTTIGLIRATKAEKAAREEAETARQVSRFIEDLFSVSDPSEARGNQITAREILDKGAEKIATELKDQPLVQARLMVTMGRVYRGLGLYDQSSTLLREALQIARNELGDENIEVAGTQEELGRLMGAIGDFAAALPLFKNALAIKEKLLGIDHPEVGQTVSNIGNVYRQTGSLDQARPLYERALSIREKALGPNHPDVSNSLNGLAIVLESMGDYKAAKPLYERALALREKAFGRDHPLVATSLNNLATLCWFMGDYNAARPLNERALAIQEKVLGPNHPDLAHTLNTMANLYQAAGNYSQSQKVHERALAIRSKYLRSDHPRIAESYYNLACVAALLGKKEAAISFIREAIQRGFAKPLIFTDKDLASLRGNAEFDSLVSEMKKRIDGQ